MTDAEASSWLGDLILAPKKSSRKSKKRLLDAGIGRKDVKTKPDHIRAGQPLGQILSHVVAHFKELVVDGWAMVGTGKLIKDMTPDEANFWRPNHAYSMTTNGCKGIINGISKDFKYLGASRSLQKASGVGTDMVLTILFGHYGLAARFVWEALTTRYLQSDASGPDIHRYKAFVAQVIKHNH